MPSCFYDSPAKTTGRLAETATKDKYDVVVIIGPGLSSEWAWSKIKLQCMVTPAINYRIIGNGDKSVFPEDVAKKLDGKIDSDTSIFIFMHGARDKNELRVQFINPEQISNNADITTPTSDFLNQLENASRGERTNVHLLSCYSATASVDNCYYNIKDTTLTTYGD